jgi:uncharacterized protein (DUF1800 family)
MHTPSTSPLRARNRRNPCRRGALLALLVLAAAHPAAAQDDGINRRVWQMYYGLTPGQVSDPSWLAQDSDGDGLINSDELAEGTNPLKSTSITQILGIVRTETHVEVSVNTVKGKLYILQQSSSIGGTWSALNPSVQGIGAGTTLVLTAPSGMDARYYRVLVQDTDTDGDNVSDWAERIVGYDPTTKNTKGNPVADFASLNDELTAQNQITITAVEPVATQPPYGETAATDTATFAIKRGGTLHFGTITVPLTLGGTAAEGVDYAPLPNSVTLGERVGTFNLLVTPMANPTRVSNGTVTVKVGAGGGYQVSSPASGSAVIQPAGQATGTGLYAIYKNASSSSSNPLYIATYKEALFTSPNATRVDPQLAFQNTGATGWPSGVSPVPGVINTTYWVARWTGQFQPQYTERYYIRIRSDDGVKFWLNDQLVLDNWGGGSDRTFPIDCVGGVRYNIRVDFNQRTNSARMELWWYSASQPQQYIPKERLYPTMDGSTAQPFITSAQTAVGFVGQPFSYQITASSSGAAPTTYSIDPTGQQLPYGLTLQPGPQSTTAPAGTIGGTPTTAGEYQIGIQASNSAGIAASVLNLTILPPGSGVTREKWTTGVANTTLRAVNFDGILPNTTDSITQLNDTGANSNNVGQRLRGYITAPATGNYYFWLAASGEAELWISNDEEVCNKVLRARVGAVATEPQAWSDFSSQKSPWLALVAGKKYYYEVRQNRGTVEPEHVSVGWLMDPTGNAAPIQDGTGLIPAYVLTQYSPPPAVAPTGTLYATNMAPQGSAQSKAVGNASLRVNEDKTQAILYLNYSGLTSPKTAYHIHTDAFGTHPQGEIVFDLDDIDRFHSDKITEDGGYIWDITPVGTQTREDIIYAIEHGLAYINVHSVNYPAGEIRGNFSKVVGSQTAPVLVPNPTYADDHATNAGAARFLSQGAFGAHPDDLARVKSGGFDAWITYQMGLTPTYLTPDVLARPAPEFTSPYKATQFYNAWWRTAVTAPDQLRQRTAFALSEIMVISFVGDAIDDNSHGRMVGTYYDLLVKNAFGNYRDLLEDVTLNIAMGRYLDMRNNQKGDLTTGRQPNENFAREIMQLFSFGLNRLWPDGTAVLDSQGSVVPTYNQAVVNGMARVFTGWNYGQDLVTTGGVTRLPTNTNPAFNDTRPMTLIPSRHELGAKEIFDNIVLRPAAGYALPAGSTTGTESDSAKVEFDAYCLNDLEQTLDHIYNHSSTGPYICRQLIQRLVTSAPSPEYVHRVTAKFNDDGSAQHVRGNMGAVIRAILMDAEARDTVAARASTTFGKQREPLMRVTNPARTFPSSAVEGTYTQGTASTAPLLLNVTTTSPHKLTGGNAVSLDFVTANGGYRLPSDASYTVASTPAPTATTFSVIPGGQSQVAYVQEANSDTVAITATQPTGRALNLRFPPNGPPSGIYTVTGQLTSPTRFTIHVVGTAPTTRLSGNAMLALTACQTIITSDGAATPTFTMRIRTTHPHNLNAGTQFTMDFSGNPDTLRPDGIYTVAAVQGTHELTATTQVPLRVNTTGTSDTIYPFNFAEYQNGGTVVVNGGKFDPGSTNGELAQTPMAAPTVFNFFAPEYMYPGQIAAQGLTTPEFQITTDTNIVNMTNAITAMILESNNTSGLTSFKRGANNITLDLTPWLVGANVDTTAHAATTVDNLDDLLTGGALSDTARDQIAAFVTDTKYYPAVSTTSTTPTRDRVRAILQLILTSAEYATQR